MEAKTVKLCLTIADRDPVHGVHALHTAAKVLAELQAGRQERDITVNWKLAPAGCGSRQGIALCGLVTFRSQWQLQAYWDYIQKRFCDMIDERKVSFHLSMGNCQENGG